MFFLVGFVVKTSFYAIEPWLYVYDYFLGIIMGDLLSIFWNITPVVYVLFEHHRTFKAQGT